MAGGIYEQSEWPDSRWDCVTVCDGCHTVVWGTFWDDYDSAARDAYFARNGWRNYCVPGDTEILELCPACAVRALRRGETRGLADTWLRPTHAYTHAFREVDAQLSARERVVANLLLTEGGQHERRSRKTHLLPRPVGNIHRRYGLRNFRRRRERQSRSAVRVALRACTPTC